MSMRLPSMRVLISVSVFVAALASAIAADNPFVGAWELTLPKNAAGWLECGQPEHLFACKDLTGWRLTDPNAINGWSAKDHLLVNEVKQEEGKPHKNYGNLRTDKEFEDFNLKLEARLAKGRNSGVYL